MRAMRTEGYRVYPGDERNTLVASKAFVCATRSSRAFPSVDGFIE